MLSTIEPLPLLFSAVETFDARQCHAALDFCREQLEGHAKKREFYLKMKSRCKATSDNCWRAWRLCYAALERLIEQIQHTRRGVVARLQSLPKSEQHR